MFSWLSKDYCLSELCSSLTFKSKCSTRWGQKLVVMRVIWLWCSLQKNQHWTAWIHSHYLLSCCKMSVGSFPWHFSLWYKCCHKPSVVNCSDSLIYGCKMQVGFSVLVADMNANQRDGSILSNLVLLSKSSWNELEPQQQCSSKYKTNECRGFVFCLL